MKKKALFDFTLILMALFLLSVCVPSKAYAGSSTYATYDGSELRIVVPDTGMYNSYFRFIVWLQDDMIYEQTNYTQVKAYGSMIIWKLPNYYGIDTSIIDKYSVQVITPNNSSFDWCTISLIDPPTSGDFAETLHWVREDNGVLRISGTGKMDFPTNEVETESGTKLEYEKPPWYGFRKTIRTVIVENGVTSIGYAAFNEFENLESVTIADSVTSIGEFAFNKCEKLVSINLPQSVRSIGQYAFYECGNIVSIAIPTYVESIKDTTFAFCSNLKEVSFPSQLKSVGNSAFFGCEKLEEVSFPTTLTFIDHWAFGNCSSLTEVIIPEGVRTIGQASFANCTGLISVDLPFTLESIGDVAFCVLSDDGLNYKENDKIKNVYYNGTEEMWNNVDGSDRAFTAPTVLNFYQAVQDCGAEGNNLTWVFDFSSKTLIIQGSGMMKDFDDVGNLAPWHNLTGEIEYITFPDGLTNISSYAFYNCNKVKSISVPSGVTLINNGAFSCMDSLERIDIPSSVKQIGYGSFFRFLDNSVLKAVHYYGTINSWQSITIESNNEPLINAKRYYDNVTGHVISFDSNGGSGDMNRIVFDNPIKIKLPSNEFEPPNSSMRFKEWLVDGVHYHAGDECSFSTDTVIQPIWYTFVDNLSFRYYSGTGTFKTWNGIELYDNAGLPYHIGISYSDLWFASNNGYNHELAKTSMVMAFVAMEPTDNETRVAKDKQEETIIEFFQNINFNIDSSIGYGKDDSDSIAVAIASKEIDVGEADPVTLIAVALRGSGYGNGGWAGNADVGNGVYHAGFRKAALSAERAVMSHIRGLNQARQSIGKESIGKENVRFWITGFSRSAATANLLTTFLSETFPDDHIFTYGFATPSGEQISNFENSTTKIYNIVNPYDLVPMVAPKVWGFGKRGTTLQLFSENESDERIKRFNSIFDVVCGTTPDGKSVEYDLPHAHSTSYLLDWLFDCFPTSDSYYHNLQEPLMEFLRTDKDPHAFDSILTVTSVDELIDLTTFRDLAGKKTSDTIFHSAGVFLDYVATSERIVAAAELISAEHINRVRYYGINDPIAKMFNKLYWMLISAAHEIDDIVKDPVSSINSISSKEENIQIILYLNDLLKHGTSSKLLLQHWPDVYFSWMLSGTLDSSDIILDYRIAAVKCPVDVDVYDSSGNLVARSTTKEFSIEHDDGSVEIFTASSIDESVTTIEATALGNDKYFVLPDDQEYRITIQTNEQFSSGDTMDYSITSYNNGSEYCTVSYQSVPLNENSSFSAPITTSDMGIMTCTLLSENERIEPTEIKYYEDEPDITPGDVNSDDEIDANDLAIMINYIVNHVEISGDGATAADVNDDHEIDANDLAIVINYIVNHVPILKK